MKEHKGNIYNWVKMNCSKPTDEHLGYYILGTFDGHPKFHGRYCNTSMVVNFFENEDGTFEIETLNSMYTLKGSRE